MLDPFDSETFCDFFIHAEVRDPKYENSYVTYEIIIMTNNPSFSKMSSTVRRRYSEFAALYKILSKEFPALKCPRLPPRFLFKDHFRPAFIEKRREGLEDFLKKLLSEKMYLSSKALHLFLQSNHSMAEIKDIIQGKNTAPYPQEKFYHANGVLYNGDSEFNLSSTTSHSTSSPAELDLSANTSTDLYKNTNLLPNISTNYDGVPNNVGKRVSFCDQVTVAQIHMG